MRQKIAAGNWKMNTDLSEGMKLASEIVHMATDEVKPEIKMILIPPFTHLYSIGKQLETHSSLALGAQNCHQKESGAYTGEISINSLKACGVEYVVIGHSERREYFNEGHSLLNEKTKLVLQHELKPIFCCGEVLDIRNAGNHFNKVKEQISESLFDLDQADFSKIIIAYEPVWAIGTGVTASSDQAQEMHKFIRDMIKEAYNEDVANSIPILYGGSVKPENAKQLFKSPDVDGGLIGGASLKSRDFIDIAKSFV